MATELELVLHQLNERFDDLAEARAELDRKVDELQSQVSSVQTTLGNGRRGALHEIRDNSKEIHQLSLGYNMLASNVAKLVESMGTPEIRFNSCPVQKAIEAGKTALKGHDEMEKERRTRRRNIALLIIAIPGALVSLFAVVRLVLEVL